MFDTFGWLKTVVPKLRPSGRIRLMKSFYPARGALLKNICTHSEPELVKIMSEILGEK